jgi:dolichol-phosphate mannosyltransferase
MRRSRAVSVAHPIPAPQPAPRVLVVLPTYQEAANIEHVLWRLRRAVPDATVLVVDDNSSDGTAALARATGDLLGNVELLHRPAKAGLGAAYRDGFRWGLARGFDVFVEMDADLSHDPAALPALLEAVEGGADLSIGSRYVAGGVIPQWKWHRRLLSRWGNRYAGAMLGLGVHDVTSGFRAYRADVLRAVDLDTMRADGYGFQIEMTYRVAQHGGVIAEVPITFIDREQGESKMCARIVIEALGLVTRWGLARRLRGNSRGSTAVRPISQP